MEESGPVGRSSQEEHGDLKSTADVTVLVSFLQQSRGIRWLRTCWRKLAYDLVALLWGLRPVILLDYVFASSVEIADLLQRLTEECPQVRRVAFVRMKNCHYLLNTARLCDLDPEALVKQGLMKFVVLKRGGKVKIAENEEAAHYKNHLVKIYCSLVRRFVEQAPPIHHPEFVYPSPPPQSSHCMDVGSFGSLNDRGAGPLLSNQTCWRDDPVTDTQAVHGPPIDRRSRHNDSWTVTASSSSSPPCSHSKAARPSHGRPNSTADSTSSRTGVCNDSPSDFGKCGSNCAICPEANSQCHIIPESEFGSKSDSVIAPAEGCYLEDIFTSDEIPLPTMNGWLLGYPMVYAFPLSERDEAAHCLSMCELLLYKVVLPSKFLGQGYRGVSGAKGRSSHKCDAEDCNLLFSFTVPAGVEGLQDFDVAGSLPFLQGHFARPGIPLGVLWEEMRVEMSPVPLQQAAVL